MKKVIIVGGTSGIGKELAVQLINKNYLVGVTGRRKPLLDELKIRYPDNVFVKDFDITDTKKTIEKLEELTNELGGLDLIVLSSGIGEMNENLNFIIEKQTINTNILGFTNIIDWTINVFNSQNSGHLAAITSVGGIRGSKYAPAYNASKAFQINYLEGLRQKRKNFNTKILITDIRPGFVQTKMAKGDGLFWVMPVKKVAEQIIRGIEKRKKIVIVTKRWRIISGVLKIIPGFIYEKF